MPSFFVSECKDTEDDEDDTGDQAKKGAEEEGCAGESTLRG